MGYGHVSKVVDHHHPQYSKIIHGIFNKYSKTVYDENIYHSNTLKDKRRDKNDKRTIPGKRRNKTTNFQRD